MAKYERIKRTEPEEQEESLRKKKVSQPLYDQRKAPEGTTDFAVTQSLDNHATLLAKAASDEQRASLLTQLQQSYGNNYVQRLLERIQAQRGSGQSLSSETRAEMEAAFKQDFSDVRIHTDAVANQLAEGLGAEAFAAGKDIFFREGAYQPGSEASKKLLGHEMTHIIQQDGGTVTGKGAIGRAGDAFEREAVRVERALNEGGTVSVEMIGSAPALQRQASVETAPPAEAAPAAEGEIDEARAAALKGIWDAIVAPRVREAYDALAAKEPDIEGAIGKLKEAHEMAGPIREAYVSIPLARARLSGFRQTIVGLCAALGAHIGITRPLSELQSAINPDTNPMKSWLDGVREVL